MPGGAYVSKAAIAVPQQSGQNRIEKVSTQTFSFHPPDILRDRYIKFAVPFVVITALHRSHALARRLPSRTMKKPTTDGARG
jgi:hypothetical protein